MDLLFDSIIATAPHRLFFTAITTVLAFVVGACVLLLRKESLKQEKWITYFGVAFLIFGVQYLVPTMIGLEHQLSRDVATSRELMLGGILAALASGTNNLFFLATARVLMRRQPFFPWWAFAWAAVAAVTDYFEMFAPWYRCPDALLSAWALGMLGYALFTNIKPRKRHWIAPLALTGGILYAGLNVLYAINPLVTQGDLWSSFDQKLEVRLKAIDKTPELERIEKQGRLATHAVDTFLFAIALVLKLGLAAGGFLLILRTLVVISPRFLGKTLDQVNKDVDFLTGEGILHTIGRGMDADVVVLCFRLPGLSNPKVALWEWGRDSLPGREEPQIKPLQELHGWPEGGVLAAGEPIEVPLQIGNNRLFCEPRPVLRQPRQSYLIVPIQYRGHITGCLRVEWRSAYAFTATAVEQARRLAELLAPMIEERRQLAALDRWGRRVQNLGLGATAQKDALSLARLVYDTLAPLAVGIVYKIGFQPVWAVVGVRDREPSSGVVGDLPDSEFVRRVRELSFGVEPIETILEFKGIPIGKLLIAWPTSEGDKQRPVVFSDALHRKALAALVAGSIIEAAQIGLGIELNRLQVQWGSKGIDTLEEWHSEIQQAAMEIGLLWAAVLVEGRFLGSSAAIAGLEDLLGSQPELGTQKDRVRLLSVALPEADAQKLLSLYLPVSKAMLWLAVGRAEYRDEVREAWPWRSFLERLAEAADSALARILALEKVQRLQKEADQFKGLLAAGTDPAMFIHDIRNLVRNFQFAAQSLEEARRLGLLKAPDGVASHISALHDSAQRLYNITDAVMKSKPADSRSSYPLIDPIRGVQELIKPVLEGHGVQLEVSVSDHLIVAFPYHFAHQALFSLVSNSIDAIKKGGAIRIEAEDGGSLVRCHVIDDGGGIDPALQPRVFELGVSTKEGTGGKGLFLVRNLMKEHGGDVVLTSSSPGRTVFTIDFPKDGCNEKKKSSDHRG